MLGLYILQDSYHFQFSLSIQFFSFRFGPFPCGVCWHLTVQAPPNSLASVVPRSKVVYVEDSVCSTSRFLAGINEYIYSQGGKI